MIAQVPSRMATPAAVLSQTRPRMRLLVVEQDVWLASLLRDALCWVGHVVDQVRDEAAACSQASRESYDAIVLGLLGEAGRDACRRLRRQGIVAPIIILNPRATVEDVVEGLNAG